MKVTPLDIRRKEFKRALRGYADEEVDVFLDDVADEFERLFQENMELQDRIQRLDEQVAGHTQLKNALEKTLVSAQLQADQVIANSRKEGELILRDAELKARHIVNDSYSETQRVQQTLVQLKHLEEDFRFKFRSLLEGHLKLLNDAPITPPQASTPMPAAEVLSQNTVASAPEFDEPPPAVAEIAVAPEPEPAAAPLGEAVSLQKESGLEEISLLEETAPVEEIASAPEIALAAETAPVAEIAPPPGVTYFPELPPLSGPPEEFIFSGDTATEETETGTVVAEEIMATSVLVEASAESSDEATAELPVEPSGAKEPEEEELPEPQGFYFGKQAGEEETGLFSSDTQVKDKSRDFEW